MFGIFSQCKGVMHLECAYLFLKGGGDISLLIGGFLLWETRDKCGLPGRNIDQQKAEF